MVWFAVDNAGHIIAADSNEGRAPSFVCKDAEATEFLAQMLLGIQAVDRNRKPSHSKENIATKGFYFFTIDDPYEDSLYHLIAKPQKPLHIDELDDEVRQILLNQSIDINAAETDKFKI